MEHTGLDGRNPKIGEGISGNCDNEIRRQSQPAHKSRDYVAEHHSDILCDNFELERQKQLLQAVNKAAAVLLAVTDEDTLVASLRKGMELMARCMDVDRIYIWQNEVRDGVLYYVQQYEWLNDIGRRQKTVVHTADSFPYSPNSPEWEEKFSRGECVNGPIAGLSRNERDMLEPYGIKSVLVIPTQLQGAFWGFVSFDDCHQERAFEEAEVNILRSASLMMVSAINRYRQAVKIHESHEYRKLMLDATPLACILWNKDFHGYECNDECVRLFKLKNHQEYLDSFFDLSPKYQPDGQLSYNGVKENIKKTFEEGGTRVLEWTHQLLDGTLIPTEVTLVRLNFGGEHVVAAYIRDLREQKRMIKEIEDRDRLLNSVNRAATILLQSEIGEFQRDFQRCIGMMAEAVDADRVYIWKNHTKDGQLYCTRLSEWSVDAMPTQNNDLAVDLSYSEKAPKWEELLSKGLCVNGLARDMSPEEQAILSPRGVLSILVVPVFMRGDFWGFVGFDDCRHERVFSENEEAILRSASLLIANALLRNDMTMSIRDTAVQLEDALEKARDASNAKSIFLARMSHEMRTPLSAIIGLSELTLDAGGLSEEIASNLEKIYNAGKTLLGTVNDILDISKIEVGKRELVPVEYQMPSLLNDTITQSILYIGEKPINFVLDIGADLPRCLYGDDIRVKQILNNLLSNAFKYTNEGMVKLSVRCEREGDAVWMTARVRDTGIGIRTENLGKLFSDYTQLNIGTNRKIEGTGLGLSIAKKLTEMMGGTISVESEYGKGSVFTVRLRQKFVSDETIGAAEVENLKNSRRFISSRKQNLRTAQILLPYARVLVVDDMSTNLDIAKGMMRPYKMQIDCVTSGKQAVEAIREEKVRYNAIFMDHMMPDMDGIEAVRIIREEIGTEYAKNIPIIALTANAVVGNEEMFLKNGFQAFVAKPIEMDRLDAVIREWVQDKKLEQAFDAQQISTDTQMPTDTRDKKNTRVIPDRRNALKRRGGVEKRSGLDRRKFSKPIIGLDINKGIERFGGDYESLTQVLRSYIVNTPPLLGAARGVTKDTLADYAIFAHGIKGFSRSVYAETLGDMAEAMENAAKAGHFEFVSRNNATFIKTIERLIKDIESILGEIAVKNPKPRKEKPDSDVLSRLCAACAAYNMDAVDAAMAEMEAYEYDSDDGLAAWLRENVEQMNLSRIAEKLSALINKAETKE